ncbi:hypothetical protein M0644_09935 [Thermosynechococcus sp. B1]|nr:hypothetical protein [Thermosynechococcus sp. B1]WJI26034.1 hypothetical protein M0644_09935 [Thermosynechococcus sp. B1]
MLRHICCKLVEQFEILAVISLPNGVVGNDRPDSRVDDNLTARRYCRHQAEAVEHEKPEVLINRLLELEEEIY